MRRFPLLSMTAAAALLPLLAAEPVQMKAARVALFKNGYACVEMQGSLQPGAKRCTVLGMPQPVYGSFCWDADSGVVQVDSRRREVEVPAPAFGQMELLRANVGKSVVISMDNDRRHQGTISLPSAPKVSTGAFGDEPAAPADPKYVILHTPSGECVNLRLSEISRVEFAEGECPVLPTLTLSVTDLEVELAQEPQEPRSLTLGCLAYGLSWMPSYTLSMGEGNEGSISCKATIINDLVDLEHVRLELVSGSPSLGDAKVKSPLTHILGLDEFLSEISRKKNERIGRMTNTAANLAVFDEEAGSRASESVNRVEELFCYSIPDFSCPRGETMMRDLFTHAVSYRHVYTCTLPDQHTLLRMSHQEKPEIDVWHCLRLTNKGEQPWSAGIITCYAGGRFVSRSSLRFTAPGQESLLRLSKTYFCTVNCREEIAEQGAPSASVKVFKGYITLKNDSDKPMEMELRKDIEGALQEVSDAGVITSSPSYSCNPNARCTWKLHLEPGEEKTCTYVYHFTDPRS